MVCNGLLATNLITVLMYDNSYIDWCLCHDMMIIMIVNLNYKIQNLLQIYVSHVTLKI